MHLLPRNVWLLAISLSLFMSLAVFVIFLGGIIGQSLAPNPSMSTLPVAMLVVGTAVSVTLITHAMSKFGRRSVFLGSCIYAVVVIAIAIIALELQSFYLFCLSTLLFGAVAATMHQFRFAAIESVDETLNATAASTVLIGGLFSAFLGPEIAVLGKDWFDTAFVGSFLLLSICFILAFLLLWFYHADCTPELRQRQSGRSLRIIIKQPVFIVAVSSATLGYIIMSYIMTATPMSMHVIDGFSLTQTKFVIQSHVIAMFLPSLFTPIAVKLFGLSKMMIIGIVLYLACVVIGYSHNLHNYWVALILLGFGWNFLFIGGTSLLPRAYNDIEKFKVQSVNDFLIFAMQGTASLSAGWFVFNFGWEFVLLSCIPLLLIQLIILLWWLRNKPTHTI